MEPARVMDEINWRLLAELQRNARVTYSELGRRVGLTAPAVAERVKRLEEAGIITGYRVELDFEKIGLPISAYIRLSGTNEAHCARVHAIVREMPGVLECHRVTGEDCYFIRIAVASIRDLETLVDRLTPFGQTTTSLILSSPIRHRGVEHSRVENAKPGDKPRSPSRTMG